MKGYYLCYLRKLLNLNETQWKAVIVCTIDVNVFTTFHLALYTF